MLTMATILSGLGIYGTGIRMAAPVSLTSNMIPNAGSYGIKPPADSSFELTQESTMARQFGLVITVLI
jgi:hypothetical protein